MSGNRYFYILSVFMLALCGCVESPEYPDDYYGNFDALTDVVGSRYCFFEYKDIDWDAVTTEYRAQIDPKMSQLEFFNLCAAMLDELKDGHVNLSSRFNTSFYRQWWSDYPQDFSLRTIEQYYLDFDWMTTGGMMYKILDDNIGYIYYPSFSSSMSETSLDYVLFLLKDCDGIIIDIRNNGGGLLTNIDTLVGRFITEEIPGGYITHKTGPGSDDFSKPYPISYKPTDPEKHVCYAGPIAVLTNRSSYSAANAFAAVMKSLPQVTIIGAKTGGGAGLPFTFEMPCGWAVRLSASPLYAPDGSLTEWGVEPSEGFECHASEEELAKGHDPILDKAINHLITK